MVFTCINSGKQLIAVSQNRTRPGDLGCSVSLISSASSSSDGIYGVGSGAAYAIGAIHAGAKPMKAMEIAAKLTAFTSGPYITKIQYSK